MDTFPAPDDHVKTLYDNLENTIARFPDVSLGRQEDGGRETASQQCALLFWGPC